MNKAGIWTGTWVAVVCVAGGARLMHSANGVGGAGAQSEEIVKAQQRGIPIDVAAIESAPIPVSQNAATLYQKIGVLITAQQKLEDSLQLVGLPAQRATHVDTDYYKKLRAAADDAMPALEPVFKLAEQLDSYPKCDFGRTVDAAGNSVLSPLVSTDRTLVKDICLRADYQDRHGDWKGALDSMHLANRVASDAGASPGLGGFFAEIAGRTTARMEYEVLIQHHSADVPFLNAAKSQISTELSLPDLRRFVIGSIVETRTEFKSIHSVKGLRDAFGVHTNEDDVFTTNFMSGPRLQAELDARLLAVWIDLYPALPKDPHDWQAFQRVLKRTNDQVQLDNSTLNSLNQFQFSEFVGTMERVGESQAYSRLLLDSIDLLKAKAAAGKFPAVLPKSFGADRVDPFDGNPIRYRIEGSGFALYSIGMDGIDNGGRRRSPSDGSGAGYDLVESFS